MDRWCKHTAAGREDPAEAAEGYFSSSLTVTRRSSPGESLSVTVPCGGASFSQMPLKLRGANLITPGGIRLPDYKVNFHQFTLVIQFVVPWAWEQMETTFWVASIVGYFS